jgi:hypothetical protein
MTSFISTVVLSSVAIMTLPQSAFCAKFLDSHGPAGISNLLQELEMQVGRDHRLATEGRVDRLEQAIQPMFIAMPKDGKGHVDATSVRYLLHRLFVQRHGWFVLGLDNAGESWNSSSPADVFQNHAEEHHSLFNDRLTSHGFDLHQVAVFAAALETLVHGESLARLEAAYRILGLSRSESLSEKEAVEAIRAYMLIYNHMPQRLELSQLTRRHFDLMDRTAGSLYATWNETQKFAQGIRDRILEDVPVDERTTWETNLRIVEEIAERHGRWQDKDCHVLKDMLMDMEIPGTGRVRLDNFYRNRLDNASWNFVESVPYLRQLGALDESDPNQMSVIITNYLNSPSNCVSSSKFYSVCCIDQCEQLLGGLEEHVSAPYATPAQVIEFISALPSDTVKAPRILSSSLSQRLEEIAALHGGRVPLHGRLFAQWMHHAYPHECSFPHMSGTTNPLTPEHFATSIHGHHALEVGEDEIRKLIEESSLADRTSESQPQQMLPWHAEEELFVSSPVLPKAEQMGGGMFRGALMLMVIPLSVGLVASRFYAPGTKKSSSGYSSNHKYYV